MSVIRIERVADGAGELANQRMALQLPPGWTIEDHPNDTLTGGSPPGSVTGYLKLIPPQGPQPFSPSPAYTTDASTPATLFSVAIPTGSDALVRFILSGRITGGSGASGNEGKSVAAGYVVRFDNPSGTPALSAGTIMPSDGVLWSIDEPGGGFLVPDLSAPVLAENSVTVTVKGKANVNVTWKAVVDSIVLV